MEAAEGKLYGTEGAKRVTSIKQQIENAQVVRQLWEGLLPKREAPSMDRILLWLGGFSESVIEHGIRRTAAKLFHEREQMTAEDCHRYATSVMRHETEIGSR